ncbi:MAG: COX15/CtaA family protein [Gammaproteobacteria bacterium]|nr:COX15/CtaA family protein [Gammaproteobacteria bacterium]
MTVNKQEHPKITIPAKNTADSPDTPGQVSHQIINNPPTVWYKRLTAASVLLALVVVVLGAWVRLTDAGLGCPDWPGCYGQIGAPQTAEDIASANAAYPDMPVETKKAWHEMIHRYVASLLGLMIVVLTLIAYARKQERGLSSLLLGMVIFQGMLGMWTVTLLLKPVIVMAHLLGGLTVLSLLLWLLLRLHYPHNHPGTNRISVLATTTLLVLIVQIALGGWTSTNYAATACPDFPTCQNEIWPDNMDFAEGFVMWRGLGVNYEGGVLATPARVAIHFAHRLWAVVTMIFIVFLAVVAVRHSWGMRFGLAGKRLKRSAITMKVLLFVQLGVAIAMILQGFPLGISTAHNAFAALLLLSTVAVLYFAREND